MFSETEPQWKFLLDYGNTDFLTHVSNINK